jgi:hypothetical protein
MRNPELRSVKKPVGDKVNSFGVTNKEYRRS